ncbi:MAG: cytochrome c [Hyphomicrobiaceae bacterium]
MNKTVVLSGLSIVAAVAVAASAAVAAGDAIAKRKAYMKSVGGAAKQSGQMIKGEQPYDAKAAAANMTKIAAGWADFAKQFPKGTETGGETTASPKIWSNMKEFDDKGKALAAAAEKAVGEAAKGKDAFAAAFKNVGATCKGCHETYRIKKK